MMAAGRGCGELGQYQPLQLVTALACQRFASNCATRILTIPHDTTLDSVSHLGDCAGT